MSLSSQKKAIVLLLNDSGMQLYSWEQGALTWRQAFRATPAELEDFGTTLDSFTGLPAIIVTDLIEESFRHDTVVHVSGADRVAVLKRKLDFVFRNTTYRLAKVIERETTGRRDDRIMLSAVTKPDLIEIWVRTLLEKRFAIQSVTSIAHLLHDFVAIEKLDKEEYLLVINVEQGGNLRQTFIRKGAVMFSRLTPMQLRENALLGSDVLQETLQLRQYFERIQFLPYEAVLRIQVYSAFDDNFLQIEARSTENNRFEVFDVGPLLAALKVDLGGQEPSPVHYFTTKVLTGKQPTNIYAPPSATKYQDLRNFSRTIWASAALVLVAGLGISAVPGLSIIDQWQQRDAFEAQTAPLVAEYNRLSERFPETPIPSRDMELVVETHDAIVKQVYSPIDAMNMIARALDGAEGLQLTGITWELVEKPEDQPAADDEDGGRRARPRRPSAQEQALASAGIVGLVLQGRTALKVQITGEAFSENSFREAQAQVDALVSALALNPGVTVFASEMPTQVRTDISISNTVDNREVRGPFVLDLMLTPPEPAQLAADENRP
jgi:hypothetical protein